MNSGRANLASMTAWAALALGLVPVGGCGYIFPAIQGGKMLIDMRDERKERKAEAARADERHKLDMEQAQRDQEARERAEQDRRTAEAERNRNRAMPPDVLENLADKIAATIAHDLPRTRRAREHFAEHETRMVLRLKDVQNRTQHTPTSDVESLRGKVMARLRDDPEFSRYFLISEDRDVVESIRRKSEGDDKPIFDDDAGNQANSYDADHLWNLLIEVFDHDRPGRTEWRAHLDATHMKSREVVLSAEINPQ